VPHVLIAADADWLIDDVRSALEGPDTTFAVCRTGQAVTVAATQQAPDLAILDLQIGNMGGMATCMHLHLEAGAGRLPRVPVLMLLDRDPDVFLARRSEADGWMVKPLDAFRLRRAATALLAGERWTEGDPAWTAPMPSLAGSLATDPE